MQIQVTYQGPGRVGGSPRQQAWGCPSLLVKSGLSGSPGEKRGSSDGNLQTLTPPGPGLGAVSGQVSRQHVQFLAAVLEAVIRRASGRGQIPPRLRRQASRLRIGDSQGRAECPVSRPDGPRLRPRGSRISAAPSFLSSFTDLHELEAILSYRGGDSRGLAYVLGRSVESWPRKH